MNNKKVQKLLEDLRKDKSSGASELTNKALEVIETQLEKFEEPNRDHKDVIQNLAEEIIKARPSMAPLINTIGFLINNLKAFSKKNLIQRIKDFREEREKREKELEESFNKFLARHKSTINKVMTISYSSTLLNEFLKHTDLDLEFYILESRPLFEGRRTAEKLSNYFDTNLIVDAAMGYLIDKVDLIIFGVDSILKNGAIVNKIGTYPLSITGRNNGVMVYAITDSYKYNLRSHFNKAIKIERKGPDEIYENSNLDLEILNYYFDITPSEYLTGIISDLGVLNIPNFLHKIQKELPLDWITEFKDFL
jgi:translation initiation factor 2B subunit (eIF-2B alpha/beta/delta family)